MSEAIRIAHLVYRFDCGGLENGIVNIIRNLPSSAFAHTVVSLTDSTEFQQRLPGNVRLVELRKPPGNSLAYLFRLWKILRSGRFDILHTRNLPCLEAQVVGFLARVPVRIHGEHGRDVYDLHGTKRRYRWLRWILQPLIDRFVVLSVQLQRYLVDDVGIHPSKIVRICNGVDTARFRPASDCGPVSTFVVGSVGRMEVVKDYVTLAQAFVLLRREGTAPARLVLVGDGSERSAVAQFLTDSGVIDSCTLTGRRDDIPELMREFSVFVLPSRAEGISNTILEAMATGLPVIATDVGGSAELVIDGVTGFLVPPRDPVAIAACLRRYQENPGLVVRHGQAGRDRVTGQFSLDVMIRSYRELYVDCLRQAGF